jgi:hypothetical protein
MPVGRIVKDVEKTLEKIKKFKAPKRTTYDEFKTKEVKQAQLGDKVEEIIGKQAPDDLTNTSEVLDSTLSDEFIGVRQHDINRASSYTYQKQADLEAKIGAKKTETEQIEASKQDFVIGREQYEQQQLGLARQSQIDLEIARLKEKRRDLYLKATDLQKERIVTSQVQESASGKESIYDTISKSPGRGSGHTNIEGRGEVLYNRFSAGITDLKNSFRTKWAGLSQNMELMQETIRLLKDGKVKNKAFLQDAKKLADQWTKTANEVKNLRNSAGARIGKLEDWILPQSHDKAKLRRAGFKSWRKTIIDKLDVDRIEKEQETSIENVLISAYKNIIAPDVEKGKGIGSKVAKRREESRVLHFKTGDDIINYNNQFGNPDFFGTMDAHLRQQSIEIAQMQIFGSNPDATFEKLKELARADGSLGSIAESKLDAVWNDVSGKTDGDNVVTKLDNFIAQTGGIYRSIQIASKLGIATISSLGDLSNIILGSGYRGVSSVDILGTSLKTLFEGSVGENTKLASRIGIVSEFANASLANSRFADNVGNGIAQKSAEVVIRASGLGKYTSSLRVSVGLEFAGNIADNLGKNFDDIPFKAMLEEYGVDAKMWKKMQGKTKVVKKGNGASAEFFDVTKMYNGVDDEIGYRISEMISNEMDAFVVMPTARTKAWTTFGGKKGSIKGETARNMFLFKSFPISVTLMHLNRFNHLSGGNKVAYAGAVIGANTVIGGLTLMAYDVATGKTPRDPARPAMIGEALAKGGGLGIYGDFFIGLKDTKYGTSFSDIILGVPASTLKDVTRISQDLITKDGWKKTENIWNTAKNYIPGQNLWYTRYAIEKSVGNFVGEVLDPKFKDRQKRRKKAMRLRGQKPLEEALF